MQQLTRVEWDVPWRGAGDSHQHTITLPFVNALRTLPELADLTVGGWHCQAHSVWQELTVRLGQLRGLTSLTLEGLHSYRSSCAWFRGLSLSLRQLTALQVLVISGDSYEAADQVCNTTQQEGAQQSEEVENV
jgi:hypothetical protein